MTILDFGLSLAGMSEKTIQDLNASLPRLERIVAAYQQVEPDIAAVTPLIQELIAFIKQKEGTS